MTTVRLTKHHGLGNDFLVVCTDQPLPRIAWPALARTWCDRRRGIGADGLLVATPGDHGWTMALYNADGSRAEMSGNGIRCFVQAVWMREGAPAGAAYTIATDAGPRSVTITPTLDPRVALATVDMGEVTDIAAPEGWERLDCDPGRPVAHLSLGNPHSVVAVEDVDAVDLAGLGGLVPSVNLEIVAPTADRSTVRMRVHERGAGITEACGTGACAAAHAAVRWGLARGDRIEVVMDGGTATVHLDGNRAVLTGPTTFVAAIDVEA